MLPSVGVCAFFLNNPILRPLYDTYVKQSLDFMAMTHVLKVFHYVIFTTFTNGNSFLHIKQLISFFQICVVPESIEYFPHRRDCNFLGGGGGTNLN